VAALELGPGGGEPVAAMVKEFEQRKDYVMSRLRATEGLTTIEPEGAFYVLPDCSQYMGAGVHADDFGSVPDADALCRYLLEVAHVACVPGDAFGVPQCIRISYAASMAILEEALDRLTKFMAPDVFHR
jgi:bifunctional aspartate aminotransferase and glutamate/aspartate-prephenate aminotransferase